MYDAWSAYDPQASTFFLGNQIGEYVCNYDGIEVPDDEFARKAAQEEAISYAAYRIMKHRFSNSPGAMESLPSFDTLMQTLGYDIEFTSTDYSTGSPAALGNYIALSCMEFGLVDHADEESDYEYDDNFYQPTNPPLVPSLPGNPSIVDLNSWQPLVIDTFQARRFLSPQWGAATAFSLTEADLTVQEKNGNMYNVFHDPGAPPRIDTTGSIVGMDDYYKWNFALVAIWSGHLDPESQVMVDISPGSIGNLSSLPSNEEEFREFYNLIEGGVIDTGYSVNPVTGLPYEEQLVPLGDFGRVLAEFWADGPKSETPPGHWFTLLNYVGDHPDFEKRFEGTGDVLDDLEWDVKSYFIMGGAMHDVAVAVWGMKSYYDYIRPISAIRAMSDLGQSSDSTDLSYHPGGMPLVEGHIELVREGDELAGESGENIGKIKVYAWKGPEFISDVNNAGVGWILAENWWPYQKPSFITPPFAGYVSGHSTFSRAAAEVMTLLTGDPYFPGGMASFHAPKDDYLLFEKGPSVDVVLQWATYRDASDQASLSRLWGGIHPPIDDVPGRQLGAKIGPEAFAFAQTYFNGVTTATDNQEISKDLTVMQNYPNPITDFTVFEYSVRKSADVSINIYDISGRLVNRLDEGSRTPGVYARKSSRSELGQVPGTYFYRLELDGKQSLPRKMVIVQN